MEDDTMRAEQARKRSPYLNTPQAAHYLCISSRLLEQLRKRGSGPAFRRHSRFVYYHVDDLVAWSQASRSDSSHD